MLGDMTSSTVLTAAPVTGRIVSPAWARLRYGLLALFGVVLLGMLTMGVRPATFTDFGAALSQGRVSAVTVVDEMPEGWSGTSTVEIRWHDGLLPRYTQVRQVRAGSGPEVTTSNDRDLHVVHGSITDELRLYAPDVTVNAAERASTTFQVANWHVPAWVTILALFGAALTVTLLITAPEPLLATRWAWFWALVSPVGFIALPLFLLLGIPRTGAVELPYSKAGRLTGGWSFILFCFLAPSLVPGLRL